VGKYISNPRLKENSADFLPIEICQHSQENLYPHQRIVLAKGFKDSLKAVTVSQGHSEDLPLLLSCYTRRYITITSRIFIQSTDTDAAGLCKAHFHDLECQELWFQTGEKD